MRVESILTLYCSAFRKHLSQKNDSATTLQTMVRKKLQLKQYFRIVGLQGQSLAPVRFCFLTSNFNGTQLSFEGALSDVRSHASVKS